MYSVYISITKIILPIPYPKLRQTWALIIAEAEGPKLRQNDRSFGTSLVKIVYKTLFCKIKVNFEKLFSNLKIAFHYFVELVETNPLMHNTLHIDKYSRITICLNIFIFWLLGT